MIEVELKVFLFRKDVIFENRGDVSGTSEEGPQSHSTKMNEETSYKTERGVTTSGDGWTRYTIDCFFLIIYWERCTLSISLTTIRKSSHNSSNTTDNKRP